MEHVWLYWGVQQTADAWWVRFDVLFYSSPAPPLTRDNILKALEGVRNLIDLSDQLLGTFFGVLYDSYEAHLAAIVDHFLQGKGLHQPSWRRVIYSLDEAGEIQLADKIRSFAEPVQGEWTSLFMCVSLKWS